MTTHHDPIAVGALSVRFRVEPAEANGTAAVFECHVPAGARTPAPHSHDGFEETVFGLAGRSTWTIDGDVVELAPGDCFCIPRGAVHAFDNRVEADAAFLAIVTPGVLGPAYFQELGALLASAAGPPDPAAVGALLRRHGLTPVRPATAGAA